MTTEQRTVEFHQAFSHPVRSRPQTLCREEAILALRLIEEEYWELCEALFPGSRDTWLTGISSDGRDLQWPLNPQFDSLAEELRAYPTAYAYQPDLTEVADALGDLDVVINGAGIRHGLDMQAISREVFNSNMSKLDSNGKPIYKADGKIAKGPLFIEPNFEYILQKKTIR